MSFRNLLQEYPGYRELVNPPGLADEADYGTLRWIDVAMGQHGHIAGPQAAQVNLVVYDILGREVARLVDGYMELGNQMAQWDGRDRGGRSLPSGIYIARLVTPEFTKSIKMLLLK